MMFGYWQINSPEMDRLGKSTNAATTDSHSAFSANSLGPLSNFFSQAQSKAVWMIA